MLLAKPSYPVHIDSMTSYFTYTDEVIPLLKESKTRWQTAHLISLFSGKLRRFHSFYHPV